MIGTFVKNLAFYKIGQELFTWFSPDPARIKGFGRAGLLNPGLPQESSMIIYSVSLILH